ncbi:hypothetical protein SprV_0100463000 [Sparganum proliferum]
MTLSHKLQQSFLNLYLSKKLDQRLTNFPIAAAAADENAIVENRWGKLRDTIQSTALAIHARARRQYQGWFDDVDAAIGNLLAEDERLRQTHVNRPNDDIRAACNCCLRPVQQRLREMQDARTARKAEEIQGYADRNEWKTLFAAIKTVYSPTAPLRSADGSILFNKKARILQRCAEHFRSVLNHTSTISDAAIACLTRLETGVDLDLLPSLHETIKACRSSPAGKCLDRPQSLLSSTSTVVLKL